MSGGRRPVRPPLTSSRILLSFLFALYTGPAAAQNAEAPLESLVTRLAGMTAVTGYEQRMADSLLSLLPGFVRDRAGNVVRNAPGGKARTLVVCPLDEPGWVVGGVRADGYLTLRRSPGRASTARDALLEGARVAVQGSRGTITGVIAVRSVHLTRGRASSDAPFTADSAYLDVGAANAAEVARLGVGVLSVVTLAKRPHRYGADFLAAPAMGRRAACAALVHAARAVSGTRAVVAFAVEQELSQRGLTTLAHAAGPFAETLVVDGAAGVAVLDSVPLPAEVGRLTRLTLPVRYAGTPVETVSLADVTRFREQLAERLESAR